MEFINRKEELKRLKALSRFQEASVAVIWGRRRMGKTRLLLDWVDQHEGVYYVADQSSALIQRKYFARALEAVLPNFSKVDYPDWSSFFSRLAQDAMQIGWRGPLIIDELPYLISVSPELPSILQKFVDHDAKRAKLILALCGSSQRMMQGAILNASAPLYGRVDEIIKLGPIAAGYLDDALGLQSARAMIETYSIWGGIPRYWELLEKSGKKFVDAIDALVLNPMGPLNEEPNRLLLEELPTAIHLRPILDAIGLGANRLSEIASRIGQPATSLVRPIQKLIDLDLIQRELPYGANSHHSKKTLYKIKDPFIRFWFTVVAPRRSSFSQASMPSRKKWLKEALPRLFSITWEELCRKVIPLLTSHFDGKQFGQAGRFWQGQENEWDILSETGDGKTLIIGEAKWTLKVPTISWVNQTINVLKQKGVPPIKRNPNLSVLYVLFLPEKPKGFSPPVDVKVFDASDVVQILR